MLLALGLAACPPPDTTTCSHVTAASFGGGSGTGTSPPRLALVDEALSLTAASLLTSCPEDAVSASVELLGPDNLPRARLSATTRTMNGGPVTATFTFTPDQPGPWVARVVFEPSLGVRNVFLEAMVSKLDPGGRVVSIDGCVGAPWPVNADTIACSLSASTIEVRAASGATFAFTGTRLVVADDVLWSIDGTAFTLERRVVDDAGVHLTHVFPDFKPGPLAALHTATTALRARTDGTLALAHADGGVEPLALLESQNPGTLFFAEPTRVFRGIGCDVSADDCVGQVRGVDDDVVWREGGFGAATALRRPLDALDRASIAFTTALSLESIPLPDGFARLPLTVGSPVADQLVLGLVHDDRLVFTAWNRSRFLQLGHRFAVVRHFTNPSLAFVVKLSD